MRALALAAMTASAQDVRVLPAPLAAEPPVTLARHDCDRGVPMPTPFPATVPPALMPAPDLDGPEPVPIPNLCANPAPLAALPMDEDALGRLWRGVRPPTYRFEGGERQRLRSFDHDRLRQRYDRFETLPTPDVPFPESLDLSPVAPREDRP